MTAILPIKAVDVKHRNAHIICTHDSFFNHQVANNLTKDCYKDFNMDKAMY